MISIIDTVLRCIGLGRSSQDIIIVSKKKLCPDISEIILCSILVQHRGFMCKSPVVHSLIPGKDNSKKTMIILVSKLTEVI